MPCAPQRSYRKGVGWPGRRGLESSPCHCQWLAPGSTRSLGMLPCECHECFNVKRLASRLQSLHHGLPEAGTEVDKPIVNLPRPVQVVTCQSQSE